MALKFEPGTQRTHHQQAAVDRRAVRDALVAHELLQILPRNRRRKVAVPGATGHTLSLPSENVSDLETLGAGAGRVVIASDASSSVDEADDREVHSESAV